MLSLGISRSNWRDTVVLFINKNCFLNSQKENTNHASHNEWQVKSPRVCTLCQDYHRLPLCTSLSQQLSGCDIFIIYSGSSSKFWVSEEIVLNRRSKEEGLSRRQQALYPGIISFLPKNFLCCAVNIHTYTQPYPGSKVLNTKSVFIFHCQTGLPATFSLIALVLLFGCVFPEEGPHFTVVR